MLKVGFIGSSVSETFSEYAAELVEMLSFLFEEIDPHLLIITGGYDGFMADISRLAKELVAEKNQAQAGRFKVNVLGILFDGYTDDPDLANSAINQPNKYNDIIISAGAIGERTQNLTRIPDVLIALPGRTGTLLEIFHFIEDTRYGKDYLKVDQNFQRLILHPFWRDKFFKYLMAEKHISADLFEKLNFWPIEIEGRQTLKSVIADLPKNSLFTERPREEEKNTVSLLHIKNAKEVVPNKDAFLTLVDDINRLFKGAYLRDASQRNYVLGIDIVILDTKLKEIVELLTIGGKAYIDTLQKFLGQYDSLLLNDQLMELNLNKLLIKNLDNLGAIFPNNELFFDSFIESRRYLSNQKNSNFDDWAGVLKAEGMGRSVAWLTIPAMNDKYRVSAFVSLDVIIPDLIHPSLKSLLTGFLYNQTLTKLHHDLTDQLSIQAVKAAISQVMARNMSHNIGSHVLSSLTIQNLAAEESRVLFYYLKLRQEFLADISTTSAVINFPHYLYEEVFSIFLPASNKEQHNESFYKSLIRSRYIEAYPYYLVDNISGKSDKKADSIKINYIFSGNTIQPIIINNELRTIEDDLYVDFPNDILGFQSLYIILEAIIRNAFKHSLVKYRLELSIYVDDDKKYSDFYRVTITDNLGRFNNTARADFAFLKRLNGYICSPILDSGKLRDGGWGILEMKICAAYLINYPLEQLDKYSQIGERVMVDDKTYPPLLTVSVDSELNLEFTFYLLKPKQVLLIGDQGQLPLENKSLGVYTQAPADWSETGTDHQFIGLVNTTWDQKKIDSYATEINQRIIHLQPPKRFKNLLDVQYALWKDINIKEPKFVTKSSTQILAGDIVFDDHGEWGKIGANKEIPIAYYEPYNTQSLTKAIFIDRLNAIEETPRGKKERQIMLAELTEAVLTPILVIDERIQEVTERKDPAFIHMQQRQILAGMGIYVPPSEFSKSSKIPGAALGLSNLDVIQTRYTINYFLKNYRPEYLVIHLGIIEKLCNETRKKTIANWLINRDWVDEDSPKDFKIVVISGRGFPSNLPSNTLYVPVSIIQQYITTYRSKIMLTKVLKSIRKIIKEEPYEI